jgi:hypothetical protein
MTKKQRKLYLGEATVLFESDVIDGELMDTEVSLNGARLLTVCGSERNAFIAELEALVDKYRI